MVLPFWLKVVCIGVAVAIGGFFAYRFMSSRRSGESVSKKLLVINVLDKALYDDCHIKGSISVPFTELEQFAQKLDKNSEIVVYCSNYQCTASGAGAQLLTKLGFSKVWAYEGGMAQWHQLGFPVQGACSQAYLKKVIEEPKENALATDTVPVKVITAEELKMKLYGAA